MNFFKKYAILISGILYLAIGLGLSAYLFFGDPHAVLPPWSITNLFFSLFYVCLITTLWPAGILAQFLAGDIKSILRGVIGIIILILIWAPSLLYALRAAKKKIVKTS